MILFVFNRLKSLTLEISARLSNDDDFEARNKTEKPSTKFCPDFKSDSKLDLLMLDHKQAKSVQRKCTLTCCAPDGSPLQGKSFVVGQDGAVIGRKASNAIALYMLVS